MFSETSHSGCDCSEVLVPDRLIALVVAADKKPTCVAISVEGGSAEFIEFTRTDIPINRTVGVDISAASLQIAKIVMNPAAHILQRRMLGVVISDGHAAAHVVQFGQFPQ